MFIREISLCNFGVYKGIQTIKPCCAQGEERPVTLVGGLNGTGKTTILEAVLLALYGKNSPAVRESGLAYQRYIEGYMHGNINSESWVELILQIPVDGQYINLRLRRQWHWKKNQWVEDLRVFRNEIADLFLAKNWTFYVEDLIPSGLAGLFFFDGEKIVSLAEEETGETMKKAIYSVFGVDLIDRLMQDMDRLIKRHEGNLYPPEIEKEIYRLENNGQEILTKVQSFRQDIASIDTRLERLLEKSRQKEQQILKGGGNWQEERQKLTASKEALKERLAEHKAEMIALAGGVLPLTLVEPLLARLKEQMYKDHAAKSAAESLPLLTEQSNIILKLLEENKAGTSLIKQIKAALQSQGEKLSELATDISPMYTSELALNQVEQLTNGRLYELRNKVSEMMISNQNMENELEHVERHLLVEVDSIGLEQEMQDYKRIQQDITSLSIERQVISGQLADLNSSFNEIERAHQGLLRKCLGQTEQKEEAARIIEYALRTKETMVVFRDKLISHKTDRLSDSMQEAFRYLAHKKSLIDRVEIDPVTLNIKLYDLSGQEIIKQRLAAGEKQMLAISLLCGLAQSCGRMLPVIIDTPLGRLDSSHRENIVGRYLPVASHQVIVLSTDTEINGELFGLLHNHIGQEYWLDYSERTQSTLIREGYFPNYSEGHYDSETDKTIQSS